MDQDFSIFLHVVFVVVHRYVNKRCAWMQLPWGDQGYFMTRRTFEQLEGFPAIPLMEDPALLLACERMGAIKAANVAIATRPTKFL